VIGRELRSSRSRRGCGLSEAFSARRPWHQHPFQGGRLFLVSDVHFGKNTEQIVDRFLASATADNLRRVVVIAGDLTQDAEPDEYAATDRFVSRLLAANIRVIVTPGNHDFGRWRGERLRADGPARAAFGDLLSSVNAQPEVIASNDFDAITRIDDDLFVCLRSTHRGPSSKLGITGHNRITRDQIRWAARVLDELQTERLSLHLVTHRSLWSDDDDKHGALCRRRRLEEELLRPYGFASFINGHNHRFGSRSRKTPKTGYRIRHVAVPTLSERKGKHGDRGYVVWSGAEPELVEI
jgi:3',5'-cyclic AMP phosphodiesterase CpdA